MRFDANWDSGVWAWTAFGGGALLFGIATLIYVYVKHRRAGRWERWPVMGVLIVFCGLSAWAYVLAPRAYIITPHQLAIDRLIGAKTFTFDSTVEIVALSQGSLGGGSRIFGSGGLFGYFGRFQSPRIGKYYLAATRGDNRVMLRDGVHTVIVTPDDVERFVLVANAALQISE